MQQGPAGVEAGDRHDLPLPQVQVAVHDEGRQSSRPFSYNQEQTSNFYHS